MSSPHRLQAYVDTWAVAVADTVALLRALPAENWTRPTDLPGWDVRAVAAHLAHLESELAGHGQDPVRVPELEHVSSPMGAYTERGPIARRTWTPTQIVDELESSAAQRLAELRAHPPQDPRGDPPITPGGIGWSWETLLSNRVVDVWMHEQDVRRAVDRPGNLDGPAATHTVGVFLRALGFVVGKRVAPPAGTTVLLEVTGPAAVRTAVEVTEDGRGQPLDAAPPRPTVALTLDTEAYVVLSGGRRPPRDVAVTVTGDQELGDRVLAALAVTP